MGAPQAKRLMESNAALRSAVAAVVRKYENWQDHDEGAYDDSCETCRILRDLRAALTIGEERR